MPSILSETHITFLLFLLMTFVQQLSQSVIPTPHGDNPPDELFPRDDKTELVSCVLEHEVEHPQTHGLFLEPLPLQRWVGLFGYEMGSSLTQRKRR